MFRDDNKPVTVNGSAQYGGSYPAQIWRAFMTEAMEGKPVKEFKEPSSYGYSNPYDDYASGDRYDDQGGGQDDAPPVPPPTRRASRAPARARTPTQETPGPGRDLGSRRRGRGPGSGRIPGGPGGRWRRQGRRLRRRGGSAISASTTWAAASGHPTGAD